MDFQAGEILCVNKPLDWTSFNVVSKIRYTLKHKLGVKKIKVGHAGTLDPLATGLLIVCTGKMTKQIESIQGLTKEYSGVITLGATRPSYDCETEIDQNFDVHHINEEMLEKTRQGFIGKQEQMPPIFSAIKIKGKKAYDLARKGKEVKMKKRPIEIVDFTIDTEDFPDIKFHVKCSKGTYIRSLAHDFGQCLNSGAYLSKLHREAIGDYRSENAWELDDLIEHIKNL